MHQVVIRSSQGREGGRVVCLLAVGMKIFQCCFVSGEAGECGQGGGQRGMTEFLRDEEEGLWVLCLQQAYD